MHFPGFSASTLVLFLRAENPKQALGRKATIEQSSLRHRGRFFGQGLRMTVLIVLRMAVQFDA